MLRGVPLIIAEKLELQNSRPKRNLAVILQCFYSRSGVAKPRGAALDGAGRASAQAATSLGGAPPCSKKDRRRKSQLIRRNVIQNWHRLVCDTSLSWWVRSLFKMYNQHTQIMIHTYSHPFSLLTMSQVGICSSLSILLFHLSSCQSRVAKHRKIRRKMWKILLGGNLKPVHR